MQYQQQMPDRFQYPLLLPLGDASEPADTSDHVSELSLRGAAEHCLSLLGPVLRELSQAADARWLTLIAPPSPLTPAWLRSASLNRERILLLQARDPQSAFELACEALRLGRSHTVVSWLPLSAQESRALAHAANEGCAQSLNIRMS